MAIPVVIGALETISKNAKAWYGKLSLPGVFGSAQLSAILCTAHILWKMLCLYAAESFYVMATNTQKIPENWRGSRNNDNGNDNDNDSNNENDIL